MRATQDIVLSGEAYRNFIHSAKSEATKNSYTKALRQFMRFRGASSCEELLDRDPKLIQSRIIDWLIHIKEVQELSSASMTAYCAALHHFYDMNDINELNWKKISSFIGESRKTVKDRPYTRDEIRRLIDVANDKRLKIVILLMSCSGLRIGAISSLKIENLERISQYGIYQITVYENTKQEYITFCTPECASVIDSYLEYRKRNGDRVKPADPLLRNEYDIDDSIRAANPKAISTFSLRARIFKLLVSSGLRDRRLELEKEAVINERDETHQLHKRREVMQCHGCRKFFSTTSTIEGLSPLYVEILMGHKALGVTGAYFKPTSADLLEGNDKMLGYANIMKALTFSDEHRLKLEVEKLSLRSNESETIIRRRLEAREKDIENLKENESFNGDAIASLSDQVATLMQEIQLLKKPR